MLSRFPIGGGEVVVLASVQGLIAERDRVLATLEEEKPGVVAIGVSPESVAALLHYEREKEEEDPFEDLPDHDLIFAIKLREFGPVDLPPPDLLAATRWARDRGVTLYGVDMPEEQYQELFTKSVSTWGFLRYGRIQRRLAKKPPRAADPRALALAWDERIRKVKGIARVEAAREERIASACAKLAREGPAKVLLVLDVAREAGVSRHLSSERG